MRAAALLACLALPAAAQEEDAVNAQSRALLTCVIDAAVAGVPEETLRTETHFLCALAHAPVTVSCPREQYMLEPARALCERRDLELWGTALTRAYAVAGRADELDARIAEIAAGCEGVAPAPADPVGCVTNTVWRDWARVATEGFLDRVAADAAEREGDE
ncbi:hypothetical protein [Jannaschia marina]|uniref:hypothetical protein n=1 Tax=Jannaschia marina TaxID=2741674 RepID=UPI0015CC8758|nr:hypothetical protein [Jannaschia marina]